MCVSFAAKMFSRTRIGREIAIIYCEPLAKNCWRSGFSSAAAGRRADGKFLLALKFASSGSDAGQVAKRDNLLAFCSCTRGKVGKQTFINFVNYSCEKNRVCLVASCNTPTTKLLPGSRFLLFSLCYHVLRLLKLMNEVKIFSQLF